VGRAYKIKGGMRSLIESGQRSIKSLTPTCEERSSVKVIERFYDLRIYIIKNSTHPPIIFHP